MSASPESTPVIGRNRQLGYKVDPTYRPPGWLPVEIAAQCPIARAAFTLLVDKPGRSLRSIGRQLGVSSARLSVLSRAGRWHWHLEQFVDQSPESLAIAARLEAQRSRTVQLAANALYETAIDAALVDLIQVGEDGVVRLKPGKDVSDVSRLAQARNTHLKSTQLLTGEADASRRSAAVAGATKVILQAGSLMPQPIQIQGTVVSPVASPRPIELQGR